MNQQRAFTLVELSIVLVILGLLIGGVLTGQSLIRAAELRSVTTQEQRYVTAVQTFRDKYFGLPGDLANAVAYWGAADGSTGMTTACFTAASTTSVTCNGNGNGIITQLGNTYSNEWFRFWQHLANAGLIEGSYDGITHGSNVYSATTVNVPAGRISSSLWFLNTWGTVTGAPWPVFDGVYNNFFEFGGIQTNGDPSLPILKPEEAYNIDMKIDDGKPGTGKVMARDTGFTGTGCTTATSSTMYSATYLLTNTANVCSLIFYQPF